MSTRIHFSLQPSSDLLLANQNVNVNENTNTHGGSAVAMDDASHEPIAGAEQGQLLSTNSHLGNRAAIVYSLGLHEILETQETEEVEETPGGVFLVDIGNHNDNDTVEGWPNPNNVPTPTSVDRLVAEIKQTTCSITVDRSIGEDLLVLEMEYIAKNVKKCLALLKKGHDVTRPVDAIIVYIQQIFGGFIASETSDGIVKMLQATKSGDTHDREESFANLIKWLDLYSSVQD
ncbi:MAG: hypothetical protein LBR91_00330 [Puniceicoccales bacterium]|jgi:hypothetical protein|nr:hypothetical protein [Puniceicoccales bacterium]